MRRGSLVSFYSRMFDWGNNNLHGEKRDEYIKRLNKECEKYCEIWEKK